MPLLFVSGYLLGRWHNRRWRRDRFAALGRKLQLIDAMHINRLLKQYQTFYNTATPHRKLDGHSPIWQKNCVE